MKRLFPFVLLLCCVVLSSCLEGSDNYIPSVSLSYFVRHNGQDAEKDTLLVHYDAKEELYYLDSVSVGDTLRVTVGYSSYANFLVSTSVDWDSTKVSLHGALSPEFNSVLLSSSDTALLRLDYMEGYNFAAIPLCIVPLRSSDCRLSFSVTSDAKKVSNTSEQKIMLYIK